MIQFRTLASVGLRGAQGESLDAVLAQPKRLTVLAYLVLARPRGFQRRDLLRGLFWPDSDARHAREALNQSLLFLRRSLGSSVVQSRGPDDVGIDPSRLWCDAIAFEERIAAGHHTDALALYRGELLEGLFLSDAPLFEQWLDAERAKLRDLAREAACRVASRCQADRDVEGALHWARRALALAPYDEAAFRRVIELLDRAGDRATAVREYELFAKRLLDELEVQPSPETQAAVEGVRARATPNAPPGATRPTSPDASGPDQPGPDADVGMLGTSAGRIRRLRRSGWFGLGLLVAATAAGIAVQSSRDGRVASRPEPGVVAVLPFRVSGADPQLAYLREGMMDLLAAKLAGEGGMRAVDSRTLLAAWRRMGGSPGADPPAGAAVELARSLRSGRVLLGEIVGTPAQVVLTARLLEVPSGRSAAVAGVQGPADSLAGLVDRLATQLLSLESGSKENGLAALTTTSLPALRAYLEGKALNRRGRYRAAIERFDQAMAYDSTFALAALGLADAGGWVDFAVQARGLTLAWTLRDRLSARDEGRLLAVVGTRHPLRPTGVERIESSRALLRDFPDAPEVWYRLGDALFHNGRYVGEAAPEEQAIHAFQEAIRLDTTFADPMHHLIDLLAQRGDTAAVRQFARMYFAVDSAGETAEYLRWRVAAALHDEAALRAFWNRASSAPTSTLGWILGAIQKDGVRPEDFERAMAVLEPRGAWWGRASALLNRGRPVEAGGLLEHQPVRADTPYPLEQSEVFNALFWDGDVVRGTRAARALAAAIGEPVPAEPGARVRYFAALCMAERWRVWHGQLQTVARSVQRLRDATVPAKEPVAADFARLCALELEAEDAVQRHRPEARRRVAMLDSAYRTGPHLDRWTSAVNLTLARLLEAVGDRPGALAALRRRVMQDIAPQIALSTFLREEARLAALTGDREGAIHAYRRYLVLRSDPEPGLRPQVEQARAELARLTSATRASTHANRGG